MELIAGNLVKVYKGEGGKEAWEKITLASTIGGMVINTAGVTLAHGMEHPASGLKNIVHGQGLAALTPVVIDASYKGDEEKFGKQKVFMKIGLSKHQNTPDFFFDEQGDTPDGLRMAPDQRCLGAGEVCNHL